jgi:glucose/arabinose dehydrogenase
MALKAYVVVATGIVLLALSSTAAMAECGVTVDFPALHIPPAQAPDEHNAGTRAPDEPRPVGAVLETRPKLDWAAAPAFEQQTRAVNAKTTTPISVSVITDGLERPWGMAFLPNGQLLVTEKCGRMLTVTRDGKKSAPITGLPKIFSYVDAGLFDVALDSDFSTNRRVFFSYVEMHDQGANSLVVSSAILSPDASGLSDVKKLFSGPDYKVIGHYGGRMMVTPDHKLLVAVGDHFLPPARVKSQDIDSAFGKLLRINFDGSIPTDNPFSDVTGAERAIWALGLRNVEGLAYDATGDLWAADIGPWTGDEINKIASGHNYGWPLVSYGNEYTGKLINGGRTQWPGTDQPIYYWDPTIAPSGITFYSGDLIPEWKGNLFVTALTGQHLARLIFKNGYVVGEERLLQDMHNRFRAVTQGPDGALWVLTDSLNGRLLRLAPASK